MLHKIPGDLIQTLGGGDDVVIPLEFLLQPLAHVDVAGVDLLQLGCDALIQVPDGHAQFVAPRVIVERHGCPVLDRTLEIVGGDVIAEDPARDLVVLEQGACR